MDATQASYSLNLLRELSKPHQSFVVSPFSITIAFRIVYLGAAGDTKAQIHDVFAKGCSEDDFKQYLSHQLHDINAANKEYVLNTANRLYCAKDFQLKTTFINAVKTNCGGQLESTDFKKNTEAAEKINGWVEEQTKSKIKNLIQPSMLDENTFLVIVNAIYFKGKWREAFDKNCTQKKTFYVAEGKEKSVDMMYHSAMYYYYVDEEVQIVGIPYKGENTNMFIILPKERFGLEDFVKKIDGSKLLSYFHQMDFTKVEVSIPKFTLEKQFDLKQVLSNLGIKQAFTAEADFTEMCSEPINISKVVHKAFIEVNEEGTEAAAATGAIMMLRMAPVHEIPPSFVADHPFMFAIVKNDNLLFAGQYY